MTYIVFSDLMRLLFICELVCFSCWTGAMVKVSWDPKRWMTSCIEPSWSYFLRLSWWVHRLIHFPFLCVCSQTFLRAWEKTLIKAHVLASVLICVWYCMLLPVGLRCVCNCEHSVIPLDYLHAFPSAQLSCNPWGPGSRGLNLVSSQYYYTSQGARLRHNQNTTSRCTFIERVFTWIEKSETLSTVFGYLSQTRTHTLVFGTYTVAPKLSIKLWHILHGTNCTQKTCCSNRNAFYPMIRSQLLHDHFAIAT